MLSYTKLWKLLNDRGMKKTDLKAVISSATLAKLGKNEPISSTVIEKICDFLNCQPGDIMENISKEDIIKAGEIMNTQIAEVLNVLMMSTGMSKEALADEVIKDLPALLDKLKNGDTDFIGIENLKQDTE